jgi:hypothetical protein
MARLNSAAVALARHFFPTAIHFLTGEKKRINEDVLGTSFCAFYLRWKQKNSKKDFRDVIKCRR